MRNILLNVELKENGAESECIKGNVYLNPPEEGIVKNYLRRFRAGRKDKVQETVNTALWMILEHTSDAKIEFHLLPDIPYKFDRKEQTATVQLQDGASFEVYLTSSL